MQIEHCQTWLKMKRHLIANEYGSVQLELHEEKQKFGGKAYIYALWVEPQHRRNGHGRKLLKRAEEIATQQGYDAVYLDWCELDTERYVLDWYMRNGYDDVAFGRYNVLLKKTLTK